MGDECLVDCVGYQGGKNLSKVCRSLASWEKSIRTYHALGPITILLEAEIIECLAERHYTIAV